MGLEELTKSRRNRRKKRYYSRAIFLLTVILVALLVFAAVLMSGDGLQLQLQGDQQIVLEYGTDYQPPQLSVTYNGKAVEAHIAVDQPEMDQLGTYQVIFTAQYKDKTVQAEQTVTVVDTTAPEITLLHIPGYFVQIGESYVEEGFVAKDGHDGDITDQVVCTVSEQFVIYTVTDSSGNSVSVQRPIIYGDSVPPVITLLGDSTITLIAGAAFTEPGFTATDNVDGDITSAVTTAGEYDISQPGAYVITYSVTDSYGNQASVERTLIVLPKEDPVLPEKVIYLTFDDGPSVHTPKLLAILEKYNVKATFFVVGTSRLDYLDDIAEAGHAIGVHTNTHVFKDIYASEEAFFKDFYALYNKIFDLTGIKTDICRFPGGSSNTTSRKYCVGIMTKLTQAVEEKGFAYFDWNVDSNDAGGAKTAEEVYQNVISGIGNKKAAVVLQHDIWEYSVDAVEKIIQWGLANGYTFLPLDHDSPGAHHPVNN